MHLVSMIMKEDDRFSFVIELCMAGNLGSDLKDVEYIMIRNKWIIYLGMIWKTVN